MTNASEDRDDALEGLWDATDVAQYLKVSRSWVYNRAESGLLPVLRVGGLLRFSPETVRAFARGDVQLAEVRGSRGSATNRADKPEGR